MYLVDYHIHSHFSKEGKDSIDAICQRAISKELEEIAITEFCVFDPENPHFNGYNHEEVKAAIDQARETYAGQIVIRHGVDIGYETRYLEEIEEFLEQHLFDFTIASVHHINEHHILSDDARDFFASHQLPDAYIPYFFEVRRAAECKMFDLIGHLDYVKRKGVDVFGPFDFEVMEPVLRSILQIIVANEMGLEINTSGLRQSPRDFYPAAKILKLYQELGGEVITIGSDAFSADHVGAGAPNALWLAYQTGFRFITTFEQGEPAFIPIEMH